MNLFRQMRTPSPSGELGARPQPQLMALLLRIFLSWSAMVSAGRVGRARCND